MYLAEMIAKQIGSHIASDDASGIKPMFKIHSSFSILSVTSCAIVYGSASGQNVEMGVCGIARSGGEGYHRVTEGHREKWRGEQVLRIAICIFLCVPPCLCGSIPLEDQLAIRLMPSLSRTTWKLISRPIFFFFSLR
ncbi:hypothetical protein LF1_40360 [Rubripirellula obstinata]|uniref:Uncharacterized protein n=1 Tax=Rubripirellula obstinata TaxID=406547 RepID=A0A5B1CLS8_9BACT|nr:hypothetical protein LF1_40360 [Rubripirellula obstinata]